MQKIFKKGNARIFFPMNHSFLAKKHTSVIEAFFPITWVLKFGKGKRECNKFPHAQLYFLSIRDATTKFEGSRYNSVYTQKNIYKFRTTTCFKVFIIAVVIAVIKITFFLNYFVVAFAYHKTTTLLVRFSFSLSPL